jgi:KaiC/GvpD/RAD55 family RecA-like ATPase
MPRKSEAKPAVRTATISNQARIENLITMHNIVGPDAVSEIMSHLLKQSDNLDAIVDDGERVSVAEQMGWDLPTEEERVDYVLAQIKRSTGAKGKATWQSCIKGDKLVDAKKYHKTRNQRLREQVRQTSKKVLDAWNEAENRQVALARTGGAETISWEEGEDFPVNRISTFHPALDRWFGSTLEEVKMPGKKESTEVETHGIAEGFSYALGAKKGTGKTRLMVRLLRDLCGPQKTREDGVRYGGHNGLYIQAEIPNMGRFRSTFLDGVWDRGQVSVDFAQVTLLDEVQHLVERDRPDFLVIDSKDMIHEFQGPDNRVREGMLRFNEMLVRCSCTAIVVSHIAKSSGDLKGSSMFGHSVDAIIHAAPDEQGEGRVLTFFDKNRGGETLKRMRWVHGPRTIELDEGKVIKSKDAPDLTRLAARNSGAGSTSDAILSAIEQATGRPVRTENSNS